MLVLVLIALAARSPAQHSMLGMLVVVAAGVLGLWTYERLGAAIHSSTGSAARARSGPCDRHVRRDPDHRSVRFPDAARAAQAIPRILNEFVVALALIGYVIYRLDAVGVNLASLITTSAVVTGALAFSAQETLGNLWGGIAIQLEKTCRIGDWVRHRHDYRPGRQHPLALHGDRDDHQRDDRHSELDGDEEPHHRRRPSRRGTHAVAAACSRSRSSIDYPPARVITQVEKELAHAPHPERRADAAADSRLHRIQGQRHRIRRRLRPHRGGRVLDHRLADPLAHLRGADAAGFRHLIPAPHRRGAARRAAGCRAPRDRAPDCGARNDGALRVADGRRACVARARA